MKKDLIYWMPNTLTVILVVILFMFTSISTGISFNHQNKEIVMVYNDNAGYLMNLEDHGADILVNYNNGYALIRASKGFLKDLENTSTVVDAMPDRTLVDLNINNISFDWTEGEPDIPENLRAPAYWNTYIVMFVGPIQSTSWIQDMIDLGATIHSTVPKYGYVVKMGAGTKAKVRALPHVAWVGTYHPAYKISDEMAKEGNVMVEAHTFPGTNIAYLAGFIDALGATINSYYDNKVYFTADASLIPYIASMPDIELMFPDSPKFTTDIKANEIHGSVDAWYPSWSGLPQALDGSGEVIGIQDTGFDEGDDYKGHPDFFKGRLYGNWNDRVIRFTDQSGSASPDGRNCGPAHGTHCAGLVMGNGWCWETWDGESTSDAKYHWAQSTGVLPMGRLSFDGIGHRGSLDPSSSYWNTEYNDGARAMSNSWNSPIADYVGFSKTADDQMNADTRMILFSAGNNGPGANTLGRDGQAKNGLCVGASENFRPDRSNAYDPNLVADFSSRGGTLSDGRIKPDIVATGTAAISAFSRGEWDYVENSEENTPPRPSYIMDIDEYDYTTKGPGSDGRPDYRYMHGTSVACPIAAGEYLLVREYLREIEGISVPPSELTKAMLINGAEKMNEELYEYPGYDQGWGRIDLKNSLYPDAPATVQYDTHTFTATGSWSPSFNMGIQNGAFLKVTTIWKDVSGVALSRDVDLTLTSPSGDIYKGNAFSTKAPYWSLGANANANRPNASGLGGHDGVNNVEQVWIEVPEKGFWSIDLTCTNVNGDVPVAVVMSADIGMQEIHAPDLTTDSPTTLNIVAGGQTRFQFNVHNFGMSDDVFDLSHDSPFNVYWTEDPIHVDSGNNTDVIATISAGTLSAGTYDLRIIATSQGDSSKTDKLLLRINVLEREILYQYEVTSDIQNEQDPSVVTFTDSVGTSHIFISYINTTANGNRVYIAHDTLQDDGTPSGSWTYMEVTAPNPDYILPRDPRIYVMSGGSYQDRVFIVWLGNLEGAPKHEASSGWISYADRGSYGKWITVFIDNNTGSQAYNYKITNFLLLRPSANEIMYCFEHYDYRSTGKFENIDTHYITSTDGGATWGVAGLVTPGDGNYYLYPYGNTDQNDVNWVWFYWREPGRGNRNLLARLWDGEWSNIVKVWDTTDNIRMPVSWSTNEGASGNRNYFGVLRDQGGTKQTLWTGYIDGNFTSSSPPTNSSNAWGNSTGPFGTYISDRYIEGIDGEVANDPDSINRYYEGGPTLTAATTEDGYSWVAYMESEHMFGGIPDMNTICSNDGFISNTTYEITADNYGKGHQMISTLTTMSGSHVYEVFHSTHTDKITDVNYNIYLTKYGYDWMNETDNEGPVADPMIAYPDPAGSDSTFTLSATIDDTITGFSGILAAQYALGPLNEIGTPTEPSWPGTAMTVSSGGTPIETATAIINTIGSEGDFFYAWVRGLDAHGNWGAGSYVRMNVMARTGLPPAAYDINIPSNSSAGDWVFVSFAYLMTGNIETVLDDSVYGNNGTTWDIAKWYDNQDTADPWKTYRFGSGLNDLATIDHTMGVWLHLTGTDSVLSTGTTGSYSTRNVGIQLYTGWNLVGYPSATSRLASNTLPGEADMVAYYNSSAPYLITDAILNTITFSEGNAYWIHVTADTIWSVAP